MSRDGVQELAQVLAHKYGLSPKEAGQFISSVFDIINEGLFLDKVAKVKGLGTFKMIDVKDRESVDVNTGERITIEGRNKISFTPDNVMKELVNKPFSQFDTVVLNEGVDFGDEAGLPVQQEEVPIQQEDILIQQEEASAPQEETPVLQEETPAPQEEELIQPEEVPAMPEDEPVAEIQELVEVPVPSADEEDEETSDDEHDEETNKNDSDMEENSSIWGKLLTWLVIALIAFGAGYYLGVSTSKQYVPVVPTDVIDGEYEDSLSDDSVQIRDSINAAREARIKAKVDSLTRLNEARSESINAKRSNATSPVPVNVEKPAETVARPADKPAAASPTPKQTAEAKPASLPQGENTQALKNAKQMVQNGAYTIVGTSEVITVQAGQTMKKLSKFYFGDGMECYLQAYNGVSEVKEGMKLKIPKLQLKKRK